MRLGIFGGTFDPVHLGHLAAAENARYYLKLERVIFVPAARPPHKTSQTISDSRHRLAMLELAVKDNPFFEVSTIELDRKGPSYTVDTLKEMKRLYEGADLYFLMGTDSLFDVVNWYRYREILELCCLVAVMRPGYTEDAAFNNLPPEVRAKSVLLEAPGLNISSTELKRRLMAGEPVKYLIPLEVERYIATNRLYRGD